MATGECQYVSKWQVKPLQGKHDWPTWKARIEYYMSAKAASCMLGKTKKPQAVGETATDNELKEIEEWEKSDRDAVSALLHCVSDENLAKISRFTTSHERWSELCRLYDGAHDVRSYDLCMQFFGYTKEPTDDIGTHMSKLKNIWNELKIALKSDDEFKEVNLPDMFLECKVLDTLDEQFFSFRSSWGMIDKKHRTIANLTDQLCTYERSLEKQDTSVDGSHALASLGIRKAQRGAQQPKRVLECWSCGEPGHKEVDCQQKSRDKNTNRGRYGNFASRQGPRSGNRQSGKSSTESSGRVMLVEANVFQMSSTCDPDAWFSDSGATRHVTNQGENFVTYEPFDKGSQFGVRTVDGTYYAAKGQGDIKTKVSIGGRWESRTLCGAWFIPELKANLFSVISTQDRVPGSEYIQTSETCRIEESDGSVLVQGYRQESGLFKLAMKVVKSCVTSEVNLAAAKKTTDLQIWHERLGHQDKRHVQKFLKSVGIDIKSDFSLCEGCQYGKLHRLPFGKCPKAESPGEVIHSDLCGPFDESFGGLRYFVCFKDAASKYRSVYFMKQKSETVEKLREFLATTKTLGIVVKEIKCDNGGEFTSKVFRNEIAREGIKFSPSEPFTPQQNGGAECENRTLVEFARSLRLSHSPFNKRFWAELTNTAAYVLNRTGPTGVDGKSPYELWFKKKPSIKHLRVIGTVCYVHVPDGKRTKLDSKAVRGYLIGYDEDNGYRVIMDYGGKGRLLRSRHVVFDSEPCTVNRVVIPVPISEAQKLDLKNNKEGAQNPDVGDVSNASGEAAGESCSTDQMTELEPTKRPIRNRRRPTRFGDYVSSIDSDNGVQDEEEKDDPDFTLLCPEMSDEDEPLTFTEAQNSSESELWKTAMDKEIRSLKENQTWELERLPNGRKAIDTKWIYKRKLNADGSVDKFKARLVAKGFRQKAGVDYGNTFSPVAKMSTIRMMTSVAANENLSLTQFDVSTAFLYGDLEEKIYVKQLTGYDDGTGRVCRLKRSLYGLKQSPRCWNKRFGKFMSDRGIQSQ